MQVPAIAENNIMLSSTGLRNNQKRASQYNYI
jgi:hypothetical protein